MNDELHYATCQSWETGLLDTCTCRPLAAWRVRKEPAELFAWRIWRYTGDGTYEHVMRCSTFTGAINLIDQFIWLRKNTVNGESVV